MGAVLRIVPAVVPPQVVGAKDEPKSPNGVRSLRRQTQTDEQKREFIITGLNRGVTLGDGRP